MNIARPLVTSEEEAAEDRERTANPGFVLRLVHLWPIALFSIIWFAGSIDFIEPYDFWWNVKSGEIMMQTGRFLSQDVLVWTPVRLPYSNPQWGSQLLFYWLYAASPYLLLTVRAIIVAATMGIIFKLCVWRTGSLRIATLVTLATYFTGWTNYGMRPQLFAFIPFALYLLLLERKDTHSRWLPVLVPIMLFWVNVHGSFFLGVALLGIYGFGTLLERWRSPEGRAWLRSKAAGWQALCMLAAALTSLLNPYFVGIYNYFFAATNDPIARTLNMEWQSPTLYDGTGQFFFLQVALFLTSIYLGRRRMRATEILLIAAFGYLSLTSLRNVMWWGWVTAPIMAANWAAWAERRREEKEAKAEGAEAAEQPAARQEIFAFNWVLALLLAAGAIVFTPLWRASNPLVPGTSKHALAPTTPTKLSSYLKSADVPAPVFNYMEWGGYLEWELYPRYQMFIDGRFEARQVEVWKDYIAISKGRADWQKTLDRYGVRTLILNKDYHPDLIRFAGASNTWRRTYEDKFGVVFTR